MNKLYNKNSPFGKRVKKACDKKQNKCMLHKTALGDAF